mmetsp:Transcript_17972/g.39304  ORF Transcript_17972/g.39304 Transcript_17972/m.39304 type:complete len:606 (+) Transcript_17972:50-1867(+)
MSLSSAGRRASSAAAARYMYGRTRHHEVLPQVLHVVSSTPRRAMSVFVTGHGWTGALGLGRDVMVDGIVSDGSLVAGGEGTEELVELSNECFGGIPSSRNTSIAAAAAGWGHSAFIAQDDSGRKNLYVSGRPHDFQTLLRLKRLPSFLRRYIVSNSLRYDDGTVRPDRDTAKAARSAVSRLLDTFMTSGTDERENMMKKGLDEIEIRYGLYPSPTKVELPDGDEPSSVQQQTTLKGGNVLAASAGLTAIIGKSGTLYTFGLNHRGQCGVGESDTFNVWDPTPVTGLSMKPVSRDDTFDDAADDVIDDKQEAKRTKKGRAALKQDKPIVSVALGLQHGLALDESGQLFSWGKGARGQLGIPDPGQLSSKVIPDTEYSAVPIVDFCPDYSFEYQLEALNSDEKTVLRPRKGKILTGEDAKVTRISAGMNHSAAITNNNLAWVWGKNVLPYDEDEEGDGIKSPKPGKHAEDAPLPALVSGLPSNLAILDVACGSHHTSFLLEDGSVYAIGVATDTVKPIYGGAVEIIPPGLIDMPPRHFTSHFDRTTVVGAHGDQVLEVQLWSHTELRGGAAFEPGWVDPLLSYIVVDADRGVKQVYKGWMHTLVITD